MHWNYPVIIAAVEAQINVSDLDRG
eukprot:SAG31_NODE_31949_length_362_cov_0.642586_2_plen_24_part_01